MAPSQGKMRLLASSTAGESRLMALVQTLIGKKSRNKDTNSSKSPQISVYTFLFMFIHNGYTQLFLSFIFKFHMHLYYL